METTVKVHQTVQVWGNGLGVRITKPVALAAHLAGGQTVTLEVVEGGVLVRSVPNTKPTLAEKLRGFDPKMHGGEVLSNGRIGAEVF